MKRIIFIIALFVSFVANSQYTPPPGYTNINARYDWLAGVFRALGLPAGGNAAFTTGQAQRAGSVYYDSTGADAGLKVWNGSAWVGVGEVTQSALDDTAAAIRGDFPASYTDADARAAISLTTTGTSGAATYDNGTGVFNIPNYTAPIPGIDDVLAVGQALTGTRSITMGGNALLFSGGYSNFFQSGSASPALQSQNSTATDSVVNIFDLVSQNSSAAGGTNLGSKIRFRTENSTPANVALSNSISSYWVDATNGAEISNLDIGGRDAGATEVFMNIQPSLVRINNNADTLATQAYARSVGGGGGDALTSNPLSQFAATTSAQLAGVISDEEGTDKLVFNTSPLFVTPRLAATSTTGYVWTATDASGNGSFQAAAASGANTALSNLASVAINESLISDANNTDDLGSTSLAWKDIYSYRNIFKGSTSGETILKAAAVAGAGTLTLPTGTATLAQITNSQTFAGTQTFSGSVFLTGGITTSLSGGGSSNLNVAVGGSAGTTSQAELLIEGGTTVTHRTAMRGNVIGAPSADGAYASVNIGEMSYTEPGSGDVLFASQMYIHALAATNAGGTTVNAATLAIDGPMTGVTPTGTNASFWVKSGLSRFDGNVTLGTAGNKLNIATGSNASIGVSAAMTAGTITISTTAVTASSIIILTHATLGGTQGILSVGTITAGTSFVINSSNAADTGTVNWWIVN